MPRTKTKHLPGPDRGPADVDTVVIDVAHETTTRTSTPEQARQIALVALHAAGHDPHEATTILVGALGMTLERCADPVTIAGAVGAALQRALILIVARRTRISLRSAEVARG
jgi:hypothetical protein